MHSRDGSAFPPLPADREHGPTMRALLREDDESHLFDDQYEPETDAWPSHPDIALHVHQLCGHECRSSICSRLEAICYRCEEAIPERWR